MKATRGRGLVVMAVLMVGSGLWASRSRAEPAAISHSVAQRMSDGSIVEGSSSTLVRTDKGMTMTIQTSDLQPGEVHTVWWTIFNFPAFCVGGLPPFWKPCGFVPDAFNPDVVATVLNATGHVIGNNGVGDFGAHLAEGDISGDGSFPIPLPGDAVGLSNPRGAVIVLVVRSHGQPIPGQVKEQRSTYLGGGCHFPPAANDPCQDLQFVIHVP